MVCGCRLYNEPALSTENISPVEEINESVPSGSLQENDGFPSIAWNVAKKYKGVKVRICGPVVDTRWATGSKGKPTFLNIGKPYPERDRFTVIIWEEYRDTFSEPPEIFYRDKTVCVCGTIKEYNGVMEIEVRSPSDIEIQ